MTVNPDMYNPQAIQKILTVNNNTYVSDMRGVFHNVLDADVAAMQTAGASLVSPLQSRDYTSSGGLLTHNSNMGQGTPPAQTVTMYGPGSVTLTANGHPYTSTAAGMFLGVLATDVAAMTGLGANAEAPQFTAPTVSQYGNG